MKTTASFARVPSTLLAVSLAFAACGPSAESGLRGQETSSVVPEPDRERAPRKVVPAVSDHRSRPAADLIGTIRATLDGEPHTWYVVTGIMGDPGRPYSSALWYDPGDGTRLVTVGGFDTEDPPLHSFSIGANGLPVDFGSYEGSVMAVTIELAEGGGATTITLGEGMSSLAYIARLAVEIMGAAFTSAGGTVEVTEASFTAGELTLRGHFAGTLEDQGGGVMQVTDGALEVSSIPDLESLTGDR